jgi:subtilisin-like proprotein convertase family protein
VYSDFGAALWCSFPSGDSGHAPFGHPVPLTPGIWTTDRLGFAGYNPGSLAAGDNDGAYTNSFSGTSSSCPGAAGVAALVLATNPSLSWREVKDVLKNACDRIDPSGGSYGPNGHSIKYGYGRLNASKAVVLARPVPKDELVVTRRYDTAIPDLQTVKFELDVGDPSTVSALSVQVDLRHTWIGDLVISLNPPVGSGIPVITLHDRAGGSAKDLSQRWDESNVAALSGVAGKSCKGKWALEVKDVAAHDTGTLLSWGLTLRFGSAPVRAAGPQPRQPVAKKRATKKLTSIRSKPPTKVALKPTSMPK